MLYLKGKIVGFVSSLNHEHSFLIKRLLSEVVTDNWLEDKNNHWEMNQALFNK